MGNTKIEWCDKVWSPVTGCRPGKQCWDRCYARRMASRLRGRAGYPADEPFRVTLHPDRLDEPRHWRKPSRVFVCSMGEWMFAPWPYLDRMVKMMSACPMHTFLTLTKEPKQLLAYLAGYWYQPFPSNVWLGTSLEDQAAADERIPLLLKCQTSLLFVSHEPCLGPIDYHHWLGSHGIQWLISGGETGSRARPCDLAWLRSDRDQAGAAGVPWFGKQLGARAYDGSVACDTEPDCRRRFFLSLKHPSGADPAEWPEDMRNCREVPQCPP